MLQAPQDTALKSVVMQIASQKNASGAVMYSMLYLLLLTPTPVRIPVVLSEMVLCAGERTHGTGRVEFPTVPVNLYFLLDRLKGNTAAVRNAVLNLNFMDIILSHGQRILS